MLDGAGPRNHVQVNTHGIQPQGRLRCTRQEIIENLSASNALINNRRKLLQLALILNRSQMSYMLLESVWVDSMTMSPIDFSSPFFSATNWKFSHRLRHHRLHWICRWINRFLDPFILYRCHPMSWLIAITIIDQSTVLRLVYKIIPSFPVDLSSRLIEFPDFLIEVVGSNPTCSLQYLFEILFMIFMAIVPGCLPDGRGCWKRKSTSNGRLPIE